MAEASSVENLALNRFYCHICNSEISRALPVSILLIILAKTSHEIFLQ